MKFTTPCFVRVEDAKKRKELITFCIKIGYTTVYSINPILEFVVCGLVPNNVDVAESYDSDTMREGLVCYGLIDCGDNIELFKALAAKNNYNDKEQWFTDGIDWRLCHDSIITKMVIPNYALYRKATVQEIIEYFNGKQI